MSEHKGLPVSGYRPQSDGKVALVNLHKVLEERILRHLDSLKSQTSTNGDVNPLEPLIDQRWLATARTHIEQGFMALNRAVFQPERVKLPEDK